VLNSTTPAVGVADGDGAVVHGDDLPGDGRAVFEAEAVGLDEHGVDVGDGVGDELVVDDDAAARGRLDDALAAAEEGEAPLEAAWLEGHAVVGLGVEVPGVERDPPDGLGGEHDLVVLGELDLAEEDPRLAGARRLAEARELAAVEGDAPDEVGLEAVGLAAVLDGASEDDDAVGELVAVELVVGVGGAEEAEGADEDGEGDEAVDDRGDAGEVPDVGLDDLVERAGRVVCGA
jgi:hypothetical protein